MWLWVWPFTMHGVFVLVIPSSFPAPAHKIGPEPTYANQAAASSRSLPSRSVITYLLRLLPPKTPCDI